MKMVLPKYIYSFLLLFVICFSYSTAFSEVTPDGTMGSSEAISGPDYKIGADKGQQAGGNLFHSFSQFNLSQGETATFSGPTSVDNVISRITGGSSSIIDGTIKSTITGANFYFINPAGMIFGENASLDISGSFHVSTADYLRMGENDRFYATPQSNEVLSVAAPTAFGFLTNSPASITLEGSQLEVPEGETLSIVGGNINLSKVTEIIAPGGNINLISAASSGEIIPNHQGGGTETVETFGDITMTNSSIDVSSESSGTIYIRGGEFFANHGLILADTIGTGTGGKVNLHMDGDVRFKGDGFGIYSRTYGEDGGDFAGDAGDVNIVSRNLFIDEGVIDTTAFDDGNAGNISIVVQETLEVTGSDGTEFVAGIKARALDGQAGQTHINAKQLNLLNGGRISNSSFGREGQSGSVIIEAQDSILISGKNGFGLNAGVFANARNNGAGSISINTTNLELQGSIVSEGRFSEGGSIQLNISKNLIAHQGIISASSLGLGNGGRISIDADFILLNSTDVLAQANGTSSGGDIIIRSEFFLQSTDSTVNAATTFGSTANASIGGNFELSNALRPLRRFEIDPKEFAKTPCSQRTGETVSSFVIQSSPGVPPSPEDLMSSALTESPSEASHFERDILFSYASSFIPLSLGCLN